MTLDKNGIDELIRNIEEIFDSAFQAIPEQMPGREWIKNNIKSKLIDSTLEELRKLAENRPPKFFLIGRTQDGKSSLINAIAGTKIATVGDGTESITTVAKPYTAHFSDNQSTLTFVDSRGYFESRQLGNIDAITQLKKDITEHNPDIIIHVLNSQNIASAKNDFDEFIKIQADLKQQIGTILPTIIVLNKIDTIGKPREFPPEEYPNKSSLIEKTIITVADTLKIINKIPIYPDKTYQGYQILDDQTYCGIIPTCAEFDEPWNIETLKDFIANQLPIECLIQASQALKTKKGLKKITTRYIKLFAAIAGAIGAVPNLVVGSTTVKHILVITPLQIFMITVIAALSGRKVSRENAMEFIAAIGANVGAAKVFETAFNELVTLIPGFGIPLGAGIAASGTWMIGKAAEYYFFDGEMVSKEQLQEMWKEVQKEIEELMKDWGNKLGK